MTYTSHLLQSDHDLVETGNLLRRAWAADKTLNAWSVCRYDIWAQRRLNDAVGYGETNWQKHFRLWRDESGALAGAAFAFDLHRRRQNPAPYALVLHPAHTALAETMLDWVETQTAPEIEALEGNALLGQLLHGRGYTRSDDFMLAREKSLAGTPQEAVHLPEGYRIEVLKHSQWAAYFVAVNAVFNFMDSEDAFRSILQAPSNLHDLHLNVLSEQGEIAAFCSVWLDRENNAAEFEPVGTVPRFQKKGLASALLAEAANRLRRMDCPLLKVESWSESPAANALYQSCGMAEVGRIYSWKAAAS